jgi:flagellar motor component MotA
MIANPRYEEILTALEGITGEMLATGIEQLDRLHEMADRRGLLAAQLSRLDTRDRSFRQRLEQVVAAGEEIETEVRKMIAVLECEIAGTDREIRFAHELSATVPAATATSLLDLKL